MMLHRFQDRGEPIVRHAQDGRAHAARRAVAQRRGRDRRPREAGRGRGARRPHRLVGRGAGRDGRRRRRGGRVGGGAADEAARPPAAAHGARGALDQRGERRQRRPGVRATRTRASSTSTCWRWSRTTACSTRRASCSPAPTPRPRVVQQVAGLLQSIGATGVQRVDGEPGGGHHARWARPGCPAMELDVDGTRYFWYHHTEGDTLDKLDPGRGGALRGGDGGDGVRRRGPAGRLPHATN